MARDAITRRVDCHPWLAAQGELNHYGSVQLAIHAVIVREETRSKKQYYACANGSEGTTLMTTLPIFCPVSTYL
jgi:hypothetical protein